MIGHCLGLKLNEYSMWCMIWVGNGHFRVLEMACTFEIGRKLMRFWRSGIRIIFLQRWNEWSYIVDGRKSLCVMLFFFLFFVALYKFIWSSTWIWMTTPSIKGWSMRPKMERNWCIFKCNTKKVIRPVILFFCSLTSVPLRYVLQTRGYASWRGTRVRVRTITQYGTSSQSGASVGASTMVAVMATPIAFHPKTNVDLCVCSTMTSPLSLRPRGLSRGRTIITDVRQTTP